MLPDGRHLVWLNPNSCSSICSMVASEFWGLQVHRAESVRFQEGVGENIWWSVSHSDPLRSWFPSGLDHWQGRYCTFSRPCRFHHQGVFKTPVLLSVTSALWWGTALIFGKLCWVFRSQSHLLLLSVLWHKKIRETYTAQAMLGSLIKLIAGTVACLSSLPPLGSTQEQKLRSFLLS